MIQKEFLTLPIDEVIPYGNNPRINDSAVNDVIASIRQCGNVDPIEVDENNVILSGHTRLKALKALEYSEVQVLRITGLTDEQKRKYRILANKTAEKAEWDFEKLELELDGLDFDGFDFGFDVDTDTNSEPSDLFGYISNDDFVSKNSDKQTFGLTLEININAKQLVENYIKQSGKKRLVEIIMEEIKNA